MILAQKSTRRVAANKKKECCGGSKDTKGPYAKVNTSVAIITENLVWNGLDFVQIGASPC